VEFVGEHEHSLDAKGRLIFPVRMREQLGAQVTLQKGIERCIYVYPPEEWDRQVRRVDDLPRTEPKARQYARFFFSQASRESIDRQGRLTIPQSFREYAGLERDVVVVGYGSRVEIWDREAWQRARAETEASMDDITRELGI
jgi:MraZ protein